jgi:hypothetical protein
LPNQSFDPEFDRRFAACSFLETDENRGAQLASHTFQSLLAGVLGAV